MEEIEVTARFLPEGMVVPLNFKWNEITYHIESIGRSWDTKDRLHILVMDKKSQVFHIVFNTKRKIWYVISGLDSKTSSA